MGLRLRLRHDFDELIRLNRSEIARGNWFRLVNMFNPEFSDVSPENAFWVSGETPRRRNRGYLGGARLSTGPTTNLSEQARAMFYGRDEGQPCRVTAPAARLISGVVLSAGSVWVRPEFRGMQLSRLFPRIGRAYACARWPIDWTISYVAPILVEKGVAAGYGQKNFSHSIFYPGSPWGDLEVVVAYTPAAEIYDDLGKLHGYRVVRIGGSRGRTPRARRAVAVDQLGQCHKHLVGRRLPRQQQPFVAYDPPRPVRSRPDTAPMR